MAQAQPELIRERRGEAHGRLLSSSTGRTYEYDGEIEIESVVVPVSVPAPKGSRKVTVN